MREDKNVMVRQSGSPKVSRRPCRAGASSHPKAASSQPETDLVPPEVLRPNIEHLVTEDDTPVDNPFQDIQQDLLRAGLSGWSPPSGVTKFVALTNVGLFGGIRQTGIVPDFLLSLEVELPPDRGIKEDRAYYIWEYGKCPDLVVEVVSNNEGDEDSGKFVDYARMGIPYYLIYDRRGILSKDEIRIFELGPARRYRRRKSHWIPLLGLGFTVWEGTFGGLSGHYLRFCDKDGLVLPTGDERALREKARANAETARANAETARANAETARADAETARADEEKARAERLIQRLKSLGIDPEGS